MEPNNEIDNTKGIISKQKNYTVEVKYSPEAIANKLMRFTTPGGEIFEISAEEMISMLVGQVNSETLAPTFVDTTKVNVVQVKRQLVYRMNEDMKKGQIFRADYVHPYPLEFAIIEEAYKIAKIERPGGVMILTKEFIDDVKNRIKPVSEQFVDQFYKSYPKIELKK